MTTATEAIEYLEGKLPAGVTLAEFGDETEFSLTAPAEALIATLGLLRDDEMLGFDWYSQAFGIDRGDSLEVVHHLHSLKTKLECFVRVKVSKEKPVCPSAVEVYAGANWHERETFDMFGIEFEGHPDLRVILLPEGFVGNPLLKEWKPVIER